MDANLDDQDESVRIAVRALGDMRNGSSLSKVDSFQPTPALSVASSSTTPSVPSPSISGEDAVPQGVFDRVSNLPIVNTALRAYEQGKSRSKVVKYGAEMMESSIQTISRPVIDRLPVNVDEFAHRQLDRLDRYRYDYDSEQMQTDDSSPGGRGRGRMKKETFDDRDVSMVRDDSISKTEAAANGKAPNRDVPSWLQRSSSCKPPSQSDMDSRAATSHSHSSETHPSQHHHPHQHRPYSPTRPQQGNNDERIDSAPVAGSSSDPDASQQQVAQRSRWQAVLLEAGGLSAALSEDSMRRLKYCLSWLQYATAHIDAQILVLRDFTASLQPVNPNSPSSSSSPTISQAHMRTLTDVRRDVVYTIRQVVDVVSKYAGGALPEPARGRVRGFILTLPRRWASAAGVAPGEGEREREAVATAAVAGSSGRRERGTRRQHQRERGQGTSDGGRSHPSSPMTSRASSPRRRYARATGDESDGGAAAVSTTTAMVAAGRILTLATESLDMMRGVTSVVKDSLDRADAWVGRLRVVGIQRGTQDGDEEAGPDPHALPESERYDGHATPSSGFRSRRSSIGSAHGRFDSLSLVSPTFSSASTAYGSSVPSTPRIEEADVLGRIAPVVAAGLSRMSLEEEKEDVAVEWRDQRKPEEMAVDT